MVSFKDIIISNCITSIGVSLVNDEVKRIWQEAVMVYSRYPLESFKKGMKGTMKTSRKPVSFSRGTPGLETVAETLTDINSS